MPKDRKVYSVDVFRGLDKENKLLKVAPFRAAEGKNFIIDSNTLKTRPAIKYVDEIPFTIESNDFVIDWYEFKDVTVYITRYHIYSSYKGGNAVNETDASFILGNFGEIDFNGFEPLFEEEKNALMIFGLNDVFVFSYIMNVDGSPHRYVFYTMNQKPVNTFPTQGDFFKQFRDLPFAYEPTILLSNNAFEDVNLLSNVRKYKTFAASGNVTEGGSQNYFFPSDYDEEKHLGFDYQVNFYEGKFTNLGVEDNNIYPIFLGIEGEHFDEGTLSNLGVVIEELGLVSIQDIFYPIQPFEFFGTSEDAEPTTIKNITALDQDWFFKSRVLNDESRDVFNFLLNYIQAKAGDLLADETNHLVSFSVTMEYNATYKDETTNFIVESKIERANIVVYAQLRSLAIDSFTFNNENTQQSSLLVTEDTNSTTYPAYPTIAGTFTEFDLSNAPIPTTSLSSTQFRTSAKNLLRQNKTDIDNNENVKVFGQYFTEVNETDPATVNLSDSTQWVYFRDKSLSNTNVLVNPSDKTSVQYPPLSTTYPTYPTFTADTTIDLNGGNPIGPATISQQTFLNQVNAYFQSNPGQFPNGQRVAVRARYFENASVQSSGSLTVNEDRNTWTFYKDFNIVDEAVTFTDPGGTFTKTLTSTTSSDQSEQYFETQFDNYIANSREDFRPNIGQVGKLQLTASNTITNTYNLQNTWSSSPAPVDHIESVRSISHSGLGQIQLDTPGGPPGAWALSVSGNSSFIKFDGGGNTQTINMSTFVNEGQSQGQFQFDIPSWATTITIRLYKAPAGQTLTQFVNYHNASSISFIQTDTTNSTTAYKKVTINGTGELEFDDSITFNDANTFQPFLSFSNPNSLPVLDPIFVTYNPSNIKFLMNEASFVSAVASALTTAVNNNASLPPSSDAYARIYAQGTDPIEGTVGASFVILFNYVKDGNQDIQYRQSFVYLADVVNNIIVDTTVTIDTPSTIGDDAVFGGGDTYPTFSNPNNFSVVEVPLVTQENNDFNYGVDFRDNLRQHLLEQVPTLLGNPNEQKSGFAKVKIQNLFNNVLTGVSFIVPFTYAKAFSRNVQTRQSFVYVAQIAKSAEAIGTNELFSFTYDDIEKGFELRLKDYFYDYNNEPSISVRIEFNENPDYEYIAKSRFGATFGSENRLFLAGNPDFPNIDRYNVSNDLLGNNVVNQSYEFSYFPSKNLRVLGGKGAINGYVTATDSILYVTKEDYPNDDKLFIRQRVLGDNGIVGYNEFKTSVSKTPLNHKCIVRFNNDVVMLTKNGLYALELSENVLTDERLLKLRSGFINDDLITKISKYDEEKVFILENNLYMYIFIGQDLYVADSRYTDKNENNIIENLSYEIVYWTLPQTFKIGHVTKNTFKILNESGKFLYTLDENQNQDDRFRRFDQITNTFAFGEQGNNAFTLPTSLNFLIDKPKEFTLRFYNGYKVVGKKDIDYTIANNTITYLNSNSFRGVEKGKTYFFKDASNVFYPFIVDTSIPLQLFTYVGSISGANTVIYESISERPLYISTIFTYNQINYMKLSPYVQQNITTLSRIQGETDPQYIARLVSNFKDNEDYFFPTSGLKDLIVSDSKPIEMVWVSGITDMGNKMLEKTSFSLNLYATKQAKENKINFGYKTRRRSNINSERDINVSNPSTFNQLNFSNFSMSTFSETGFSMPMKENNFLYIQFFIQGFGQVEVNSFIVIYKDNRLLKTIG